MDNPAYGPTPPGRFDLGEVIHEARGLIRGSKRYAFYLLLAFLVGSTVLDVVGEALFGEGLEGASFGMRFYLVQPASTQPLWWEVLAACLYGGPLAVASASFGLYRAAREPLTFGKLFSHMGRLGSVLVILAPLYLLTAILQRSDAFALSFLLSLLAYPTLLVAFFIIDRNLGPLAALARSYELFVANLGQFLLLMLLSMGLAILGVVTLSIGLIWILPLLLIVNGLIYAEAIGLKGDYSR